jgi:disulfide bond formation protein DsbB
MSTGLKARLLGAAGCGYFWWAVAALMLALEAGALLFQHVWHYYPCEVCVYVRVWVLALLLLALLAQVLRQCWWGRLVAVLAGLGLTVGLANESWNLVKIEYGVSGGGSCAFKANFPAWAPLDKWLPSVFEVQDFCKATPELLWGISMTDVLVMVSAGLLVVLTVALAGTLLKRQAC